VNQRPTKDPLARLLESYVLWVLGYLSPDQQERLEALTPKLREVYSCEGAWHEVIGSAMGFPPTMPSLIRELWQKNQTIARTSGQSLSPGDFARMFVAKNFGDAEA